MTSFQRRFAIGAEPVDSGGTHFRVWAPACHKVAVVENDGDRIGTAYPLEREDNGYFSRLIRELHGGQHYSFRLDEREVLYPDPASRYQPLGPHGPSQVIDSKRYTWEAVDFNGPPSSQVIYELHIGTFTQEGNYASATHELKELAALGVTTIELMPVAEFAGEFGWGYDAVDLWAPSHLYGTPDALRSFVDAAHRHGLAVILDVVYNHLGPAGNYLQQFSHHYFTDRYPNEWGDPPNFDGESSLPVREFYIENARYWIDEFRFDGLRLDATQSIYDSSSRHVIAELIGAARTAARAQHRSVYIVAENEPQQSALVRTEAQGGYGGDALWNDDFHHTARVALTGRREAYYKDYLGTPQELISALKWGYLYQGQYYSWQNKRRGQPALDLAARQYVTYLQNHDQVANTLFGDRLNRITPLPALRALTTLWLLAPATPMLFQGQEFASSSPFHYFADHRGELGNSVKTGRREFMMQFQSIANAHAAESLCDPGQRSTFERCKLNFTERQTHSDVYDFHRALLALRKADPAFSAQRAEQMHGAVLGDRALALRFICEAGDRLILLNLGPDLDLTTTPEPLLAPPHGRQWRLLFSSEDVRYGGQGYRPTFAEGGWVMTAQSAAVFMGEAE